MKDKIYKFGNIEQIRSKYILSGVLSFLYQNRKLDLVAFNKTIKENLNINLEDYQKSCQKGILRCKDTNIKEYIIKTDILIFEGEYNKGKRNGKGKEYYENNIIKFEGEFLNGKTISGKGYDIDGNVIQILKDEKGKEFYDNGRIQFEGEYFKGRRWNGKGYNYNGDIDFEIKCGKGKGKEYNFFGQLIFVGEYINGLRNGKGREY